METKAGTNPRMLSFTFAYDFVARVVSSLESDDFIDCFRDFLSPDEETLIAKMAKPHKRTLFHE